jgi:Flp pilus assembly protein TadD
MVSGTSELSPPDSHHLRAAQGWLELGNCFEAQAELALVGHSHHGHPDVLDLRWQLCASAGSWADAVEIGELLVSACPADPNGWIHRSYALHELKRTVEARDRLLPAIERFPKLALIPYNLACYECQLGDMAAAKRLLLQAFALDRTQQSRFNALNDPDLRPLWPEIGKM